MSDTSPHSGLRQGIDTAGEELGERIADDLPSTPSELRSRLRDSRIGALVESGSGSDASVRDAISTSPLDQYLDFESLDTAIDDR